jgi:hypothetical protein
MIVALGMTGVWLGSTPYAAPPPIVVVSVPGAGVVGIVGGAVGTDDWRVVVADAGMATRALSPAARMQTIDVDRARARTATSFVGLRG